MLYELSYIIFCIAFAYINSVLIKKGKHIYHGLNGLLDLGVFSLLIYLTKSPLLGVSLLFSGRLFFDTTLNLFRKLPLSYIPENSNSIADTIEKIVFGGIHSFYSLLFKKTDVPSQEFPYEFPIEDIAKTKSYTFFVGILPKIVYSLIIIALNIFYIY